MRFIVKCPGIPPCVTPGEDLIMWDEDPDFRDALDEHEFEYGSDDGSSDSDYQRAPEDATEDELLDEYSEYLDRDH